ncbi:MAG TPA: neutral/alkaline non-lysosomal ceramidase N-terminal domain-containing protein [Caulifigura sp.]|nr:neutral/alkaline non-lysosomal ceramidase N-terminal domain-containing protein [Caulifigura sp.]
MSRLEFRHPSFRGRIGVAQCDITPPVGVYFRCWGAAPHDVAESIHRPLTLSAMVISSPEQESPLILICMDLPGWRTLKALPDFFARLQSVLEVKPESLMIALCHTHAAPTLELSEKPLDIAGGDLLYEWNQSLPEKIVSTVREARKQAVDAVLEWSTGRCGLASVRDFRDPAEDKNRFVCGYSPEATADDTLLVGRVSDQAGKVRATIVNYACHPTTLAWENTAVSPDYIGATREVVEGATEAPMFFLLGACGELAPRYQYTGDSAVPDAHGRQLGHAVLSVLYGMEPAGVKLTYSGVMESGAPLARWTRTAAESSSRLKASRTEVDVPLKDWPTADELRRAYADCPDRALQERIKRKLGIREALGDGSTYPLELFTWQMGEAVLIGSRAEAYSILQQELRGRFADHPVACMNLVNGSIGYLPPAPLYDEDIYPVWQTPFDRGCLEKTIAAAESSIHDILS